MPLHPDEIRPVWVLEIMDGKWQQVTEDPERLHALVERNADDLGDEDCLVGMRFRNVETGEILTEGAVMSYFMGSETDDGTHANPVQ